MTKEEMAGGIIEYARKQGITLCVEGNQLEGNQIVASGPLPGAVLAELLVTCRTEIIAALKLEALA